MTKYTKEYDETQRMLNIIQNLREDVERGKLNENNAIAITNSTKFGNRVLQQQEDNFKNTVDNSAIFANENESDPTSNPLVYIPKNGETNQGENIIFSGSIPSKNNLKFQFKLNDGTGNGCYIFVDGLNLTDENMAMLNKLYGFYKNWKDQWAVDIDGLRAMAEK